MKSWLLIALLLILNTTFAMATSPYAGTWNIAEIIDADAIYAGMNAIDYSGYPDCRPEYIDAFQAMANLATRRGVEGRPVEIRAPLLRMSKAEIVSRGTALGVEFGRTVSCYQADDDGRAIVIAPVPPRRARRNEGRIVLDVSHHDPTPRALFDRGRG